MRSLGTFGTAVVLALVVSLASPVAFAVSSGNSKTMAAKSASPKMRMLHPGDTVRLKSGSPLMTVQSVQDDKANCLWQTDDGDIDNAAIPVAALTVVGGPGWLPSYAEP